MYIIEADETIVYFDACLGVHIFLGNIFFENTFLAGLDCHYRVVDFF